MFWRILIISIVGGIIGWFTNYLAVKLIFRPLKPVKIPLIGVELQGVIPKRRSELANSIGMTVEKDLLSMNEILNHLITDENKKAIIRSIKIEILTAIESKIPGLIPRSIKEAIMKYVGDIVERESKDFLNHAVQDLIQNATANISIHDLVEDKLNKLDLGELEAIILSISHKELRYIEIFGGVLGFIIGLVQGLLMEIFKIGY